MPDLLSDDWSDSDSSQDARDVEMDIVPDDNDDNWVDEEEDTPPLRSTLLADHSQAADRHARVEDEVEPHPPQSHRAPNPAPPPRSHMGTGSQSFQTLPPWNVGLGTGQLPGRLFPLTPNTAGPSRNGNNGAPNRDNTTSNPHPHPTQPDRNPAPDNTQQGARGPRFHAHTFVLGMDGAGRPVPIPPGAFSAMFNQFHPGTPQPQAQTAQTGQPPDQSAENRDQPGQPGDPGQVPPFVDFVVGGIGPLPPFFAAPFGPEPQPLVDDAGNGGGPEPDRGAPAWAELLRAMLGGEPPEETEDPERAKKLVRGLERVPVGLVKRMTRVDSIPGACEDSTASEGSEVPGCAICWDSLLPEDPAEDAKLHSNFTASPAPGHPAEGSDSEPAIYDPTPDDEISSVIICLPCSHVFHASCLIPWFSKPKHTTCPTCRFDVDPKNLTYTPPPRRSRPRSTNATAPPNNPPTQPVPNSAADNSNPPASSTGQDPGHQPPDPVVDEGDHDPDIHVEPPIFIPDFFTAQPQRTFLDMIRSHLAPQTRDHNDGDRQQQGHDRLPGDPPHEVPDNGNDIPPPTFGFGFGPQEPPVFGPLPPPGHPTHDAGAAAANPPHDHGDGPHPEAGAQPIPFPNFAHGGVGHAHFQAPGIAVDLTLHVPPEQGLDPERISQAVQDQAAAFLRFFTGGGRVPGMGQAPGPAPTPGPGGANYEPQAPTEWMPPSAPGPTLRQRVEAKERLAGLRCDDPSCGIGPSDEDPFPAAFSDPSSVSIKRVGIFKEGVKEAVCHHVLHPACLVSADRCAGWGEEDRGANDSGKRYEVASCPVCRSVGQVQREVWEEGVKALLV